MANSSFYLWKILFTEIHKKVMSMNFKDCHTKIRHVDAHATLNDGVVVQVMGELSNNRQPMRRFMQTFVLAPEGSVANKFYVHNDIFRYQDEVFDSDTEPPEEESDEEVDEPEERSQTPEVVGDVGDDAGTYYDPPGSANDTDEQVEEQVAEPDPEPEPEQDPEPEVLEEKSEPVSEEPAPEEEVVEKCSSPAPADPTPAVQEDSRTFSWASVTSKNLPPSGAVPVSGIPPHVVKVPVSQPRPEPKPETQTPPQRPPQREQRVREQRTSVLPPRGPRPIREGEQGDLDTRRMIRYPDSHQLFVGNLPHDVDKTELKEFFQTYGNVVELRINSGGKLPNFGFVVFDDPEPVQKILGNRPIMFRGDVRLNVEEKKTRAAREGDRQNRPRGPGGPRGGLGGGIRGPPRGGMSQKPGFGAGRGIGGQRQ
ncbi:ras GTPase-activating protein-binding protein 1 isoform X2 [Rhinatrema bivittatum]|uniref:ras GTPase-activating protein-binding protein 1 isoform X2 n=1 Tax=Rhinatrema bivittatum TaxID=194408 RepID=UPI00112DE455|nr:ras GTPase-activating protein-binding protein 1 isoform X2 [Rhinatrema bivittatum]